MSGTNEALYDKRDENLICYLGNKSNGGIDLYEEYNKKYPTRDREIEESINWEDTEFKFYF